MVNTPMAEGVSISPPGGEIETPNQRSINQSVNQYF